MTPKSVFAADCIPILGVGVLIERSHPISSIDEPENFIVFSDGTLTLSRLLKWQEIC
jgi:hypothetical protein